MGEDSAAAKYLAEFVGTFMLILTVGCNVITGSPVWAVTSIACTLMVSIYALGGVSGANFNPAVSLSLGICNKLEWKDVGIYMGCQIAGGICAGLVYGLALWDVFNLQPTAGFAFWQAGMAEFLYTFMLCFVVLNVAASKKHGGGGKRPGEEGDQFYGLAIGFVVIAGGYGAGHISGGCFNPAVAIGIDVSSAGVGFGWCLPYAIFEFAGAAAASAMFWVCRPEEKIDTITYADEVEPYGTGPKVVSEFLGTYFLVLTVGLNVIGGSKAPVFSIAASLMCMIFALGTCSGAHFNPAVTVAIVASGRGCCPPADAGIYIGTQLVGGIMAGLTYCIMEGGKSFPLAPGKGYGWAEAAVAEIMFTFLLCFVVLSVATVKSPLKQYFGLAIGSCVTAGGYAIGAVSGGSLNPAVSFGISVSHAAFGGGGALVVNALGYTVFEIIGGAIAAGVFMATHPGEYAKEAGDDAPQEAATA